MRIFTTLNPNGNFKSQFEATTSWLKNNEVISVNTKEEIEKIQHLYTDVIFVETDNTYNYKNKKLIKLNGILDAMYEHGGEYSIFMNSDIILNNNYDIKINERYLNNGIYICTRYEIDGENIYKFKYGFDFFCIHKNYLNLFKNENFAIGLPWWDYWLPVCAYMYNLNLYHIDYELNHHKTHQLNYDMEKWNDLAKDLYKDLIKKINSEYFTFNKFMSESDGVMTMKRFIDEKLINIKY